MYKRQVFGADSVHGQFDGSDFKLYLGESKMHKTFISAASKAITSIESAKERYQHEFDLLDSFMDFPNIDADLESQLIDLLNPFSSDDVSEFINSPCFIGFNAPELISDAKSEKEFIEAYKEQAKKMVGSFFNSAEKKGIEIDHTALMILPFSDIDELVDGFIAHMDITQ